MSNFLMERCSVKPIGNPKSLKADWEAGKDFRLDTGQRFSIRDVPSLKENGTKALVFLHANGARAWEIKL
jgi:hypothetical protein